MTAEQALELEMFVLRMNITAELYDSALTFSVPLPPPPFFLNTLVILLKLIHFMYSFQYYTLE